MGERFQFLNLSTPAPREPAASRAGASDSPCCVSFVIARDPNDREPKIRSQNRDLHICGQIAEALRNEGLRASKPSRWKPWGAGTHTQGTGPGLDLWLTAKGEEAIIKCYMSTHTRPRNPSYYLSEDWALVKASIDKVLKQALKAHSIAWKTEAQLEEEEFDLLKAKS